MSGGVLHILILFLVAGIVSSQQKADKCFVGSYRTLNGPWNDCAGFTTCEPGYYCIDEVKKLCPGGTYGATSGLSSAACSDVCPAGHFCPTGSVNPMPCGNSSYYCPVGSSAPRPIPVGYYGLGSDNKLFESIAICPKGSFCVNGMKNLCRSGYYGDSEGLFSDTCSGQCPAGWFCPSGSFAATSHPCLPSPGIYCPTGSSTTTKVDLGFYSHDSHVDAGGGFGLETICPPGSYCIDGVRRLCPAGRFGSTKQMINSSCTGKCQPGWYCPEGSTSPTQIACGSSDVYCPDSSPWPIPVEKGHYTFGESEQEDDPDGQNYQTLKRVGSAKCGPGYYCAPDGIRRLCPPGTFGATSGLQTQTCSGPCDAGYYCPEGSTSPRQVQCGSPAVFCPGGNGVPLPVQNGYYSVGSGLATMFKERKCEPGHYCANGVKRLCDFGHWGSEWGMNISTCSGLCSPGYYCPEGSISSTEIQCGDAGKYCPGEGNFKPTAVDVGYYSTGGNQSTRYGQAIAPAGSFAQDGILYLCPAGRYGASPGMHSSVCSGICHKGYFCPAGSISPFMRVCGGDDVICPAGSIAPIQVASGFYTTFFWSEGCKPGTWRNWTGLSKDATQRIPFPIATKNSIPECELCPDGTYKAHRGDNFEQCRPCPLFDSASSADRLTCLCWRQQGGAPLLEGQVLYFNMTTEQCNAVDLGIVMRIPALLEDLNTSITRYEQSSCIPGRYCIDGVMFECPAGRYGSLYRETRPDCEGVCPEGYYCPSGTAGKFSNPCGRIDLYCPEGSTVPIYVAKGYYSINAGYDPNLILSDVSAIVYPSLLAPHTESRAAEAICPLGHYCIDADIKPCPVGRYGDRTGITDPQCSGPCDPGYYCPTVGSFNPRHTMCGNATVFCPRGSSKPTSVHEGFYCDFSGDSQGADKLFSTGDAPTCSVEVPCEPGYYCSKGNRIPCPPGFFGWRFGMSTSACTGKCAAGYYCPSTLLPQLGTPEWTVWPGVPQTAAYNYRCGGVGWYCPLGSPYPLKVGGGNYTFGGDSETNTTRRGQAVCDRGNFCVDGLIQPCPRGRYGETTGLTNEVCTQICPAGFYCPEGSAYPIPCPPGYYSDGGSWECNLCPGLSASESAKDIVLPCQDSRTCCFRY